MVKNKKPSSNFFCDQSEENGGRQGHNGKLTEYSDKHTMEERKEEHGPQGL